MQETGIMTRTAHCLTMMSRSFSILRFYFTKCGILSPSICLASFPLRPAFICSSLSFEWFLAAYSSRFAWGKMCTSLCVFNSGWDALQNVAPKGSLAGFQPWSSSVIFCSSTWFGVGYLGLARSWRSPITVITECSPLPSFMFYTRPHFHFIYMDFVITLIVVIGAPVIVVIVDISKHRHYWLWSCLRSSGGIFLLLLSSSRKVQSCFFYPVSWQSSQTGKMCWSRGVE